MKREDVYKIIDEERDYQDALPQHNSIVDGNRSVANWVIFMEHLIQKAKIDIYNLNQNGALAYVRKVTALGVACIENNNSMPRRISPNAQPLFIRSDKYGRPKKGFTHKKGILDEG